jgi:glycosyltransferase involved in cell wall biosynthesis
LYSYVPYGVEVVFKKNGGPGSARNVGVNKALKQGFKYVQLLDADDWMYDHKVEKLKAIADKYEEVGIVYDDYMHYYNDYDFFTREYKISTTHDKMWRGCQIQCNSLVKSWVFQKAQLEENVFYDESLRVAQDYDFWLRALQHCVAWHHPEVLSVVRMGSNNSADPIRGQVRQECLQKLRQRNAVNYI